MPLTTSALQRQAELDVSLGMILNQQERDVARSWATAWDEVVGELRDTLTAIAADRPEGEPIPRSLFARSARLQMLIAYIGQRLDVLLAETGVRVTRDVNGVVTTAAAAQSSIINAMMPDGARHQALSPTRIEVAPLEAIVSRTTEQITSQMKPLSPTSYEAVRRELIRGVADGASPRDVAARMVKRSEDAFNGGQARALNIARTEILDAHRSAAEYAQNQHSDVLTGWSWLAHLSPTTCRSCIAMNGSVHDLSEPGPIDHQQGRCARMPVTKSWADLGLTVEEPPSVKVPDSETFFEALTVAQQQSILGLKGYQDWKAGRFPMTDWSTVRSTPGWRDSRVPASAPETSR